MGAISAETGPVDAMVTRWRRYGKDRLYVTGSDGMRLGWHDLLTGEDHLERQDQAGVYQQTVLGWLEQQRPAATASMARPGQPHVPKPLPMPKDEVSDLAGRAAGASAREQAVARKEAAPVRTFLARALGVHTDERAWRLGAAGEEKVGQRLAKLTQKDPRWCVLHAIPVGNNGADIDHVVVGPGGVFTLNAKHHPGAKIWVAGDTFLVNGQRQPYVRNSRHEARRASQLLTAACRAPVEVEGIVVPVGADDLTIKKAPDGVHVVNRMRVGRWLRQRPEMLDDAAVQAIYDAARQSTTWTGNRLLWRRRGLQS